MKNSTEYAGGKQPPRRKYWRFRLAVLLSSVVVCALGFMGLKRFLDSHAVWEQFGGMNGWSQAAIEARLGPPQEVIEGDLPDEDEQKIRVRTPGIYRTCTYKNLSGHLIVWYRQTKPGGYDNFGSKWVEKNRYY